MEVRDHLAEQKGARGSSSPWVGWGGDGSGGGLNVARSGWGQKGGEGVCSCD
jgi:hypothetical protein